MKKQKLKKIITMGLIATSLITVAPIKASAEWKKDSTGWWYTEGSSYVKNNWKQINGKWYHFDNQGYMETGWLEGYANYFGGKSDYYYLNSDGSMVTGIQNIDGIQCRFDNSGKWLGYSESDLTNLNIKQGITSIEYDNNDSTDYSDSWGDGFYCKDNIDWSARGYIDDRIYLKDNKKVLNGYVGDYYIENGKVVRNSWVKVGDKIYYFDANGGRTYGKYIDGYWVNDSEGLDKSIPRSLNNNQEDMYYVEKEDGTYVEMTKDEYNKNIEENKIVFTGASSAQGYKYMIEFLK